MLQLVLVPAERDSTFLPTARRSNVIDALSNPFQRAIRNLTWEVLGIPGPAKSSAVSVSNEACINGHDMGPLPLELNVRSIRYRQCGVFRSTVGRVEPTAMVTTPYGQRGHRGDRISRVLQAVKVGFEVLNRS